MIKKIQLFSLFIFCSFLSGAQNSIIAEVHDSLILNADTYNGDIQWQFSSDSINWQNVNQATTNPFKTILTVSPCFYRAQISEADCDLHYSEVIVIKSMYNTYYWSDPAAWLPNNKPIENENVTIASNKRIILDENPPSLGGLTINGILDFNPQNLELSADYILVHGKLQIGTAENLFTHKAIITLTGENINDNIMGMGNRGIMVMGGKLELHGQSPNVIKTKINAHAAAGSQSIELIESADWKADDEIIISPTDYYLAGNGTSVTQRVTLSSVVQSQINFNENLNAFRWGLLQYPTATGMSLSPNNVLTPPSPDEGDKKTPLVLDERANVGHLTRNIVIQAPEDNLWTTQSYGVHIMMMGTGAEAHVEGIEIKRGGQRNRLGRYAFHWHMLSYSGSQTLEDATGQYFKNSSINTSRNRGVVIHGTNGVTVQNNVIFDIQGHGIFTEDAVERRNFIEGNLVLMVRNPPVGNSLKIHESGGRGSSGFWISNPDNTVVNNIAGDCSNNGFWLAFPTRPWGESSEVLADDGILLNPSRTLFGKFNNNTAHSNGMEGISLDNVEIDQLGNTFPYMYNSTTDGRDIVWPHPYLRRFTLSNYKVWKNNSRGMWDRARSPDNYGAVAADNCERFFAGAGSDGIIEKSLVVGTSLNHLMNGTDRPFTNFVNFPGGSSEGTPVAFATYHSTFDIKDNIVLNFPAVDKTWSGVFSTDDYYVRPVEKGQSRNTNNLIINSHPGVKLRAQFDYFTLASALWDPDGVWGPAGNYFVYDEPFMTHGKTVSPIALNPEISGGVSVPGPFYGFYGFVLHGIGNTYPQNQYWMDLWGLQIRRLDLSYNEIARLNIPSALLTDVFQHMRDFSTSPDGIYELTFPEETVHPTNYRMQVENMLNRTDVQVMSIQFDGTLNPIVSMVSGGGSVSYSQVNSLQEVINSTGETYWQDKANNRVWVKMQGGTWKFWTTNTNLAVPVSDDLLYQTTWLRIYQP